MTPVLDRPQLDLFRNRIPHRPYCTDDLSHGIRVRNAQTALEKKYVQYNPPATVNWLAYDIDRVYVPDAEWAIIAPPNIIVRNPANGHAHVLYGIAAGVAKTNAARAAPLRLLSAINESYRHALGADTSFAELLCQNPMSSHWNVTTPRLDLYDLHELAEWVDLDASDKRVRTTPKRLQVGLGRNCNLFNGLRTWCYRWLPEYRPGGFDHWHGAVRNKAEKLNTFIDPLPNSEIRATAKSIAKWVWDRYTGRKTIAHLAEDGLTPATFSLLQSNLGKMGMANRWGDNSAKQTEAVRMYAGGLTQKQIADELEVSQQTVSRWVKTAEK